VLYSAEFDWNYVSLSFTKWGHGKCIHCCFDLSHVKTVEGGDSLCSNSGPSDGVCFLQSQNIYTANYLFVHSWGMRLTAHLYLVLMLRIRGSAPCILPCHVQGHVCFCCVFFAVCALFMLGAAKDSEMLCIVSELTRLAVWRCVSCLIIVEASSVFVY
jgi:hypothetical protein